MKNIIIFGTSGHAKVVIDVIEKEGKNKIIGLIDPDMEIGSIVAGYKVIGGDHEVPHLIQKYHIQGGIIGIGDNHIRKKVYDTVLTQVPDFNFITAIHPSAQIGKNVKIECGSVVMAGGIINIDSKIGKCCIINTKSSVDHECIIGDFIIINPGSTLGGNVTLGDYCTLSLNVTVNKGLTIGSNTIIGSGSLVTKNMLSNKIIYGLPAKVIRENFIISC